MSFFLNFFSASKEKEKSPINNNDKTYSDISSFEYDFDNDKKRESRLNKTFTKNNELFEEIEREGLNYSDIIARTRTGTIKNMKGQISNTLPRRMKTIIKKKKIKKGKKKSKDVKESFLNLDNPIIKEEDLIKEKIILEGPENSPYEKGKFEISIKYDKNGRYKPILNFLTKIYHYNVEQKNGQILCPFIWNKNKTEEENTNNLKALLLRPDTRFPCSKFIKDEYYNNYPSYNEKAQRFTENYSMN